MVERFKYWLMVPSLVTSVGIMVARVIADVMYQQWSDLFLSVTVVLAGYVALFIVVFWNRIIDVWWTRQFRKELEAHRKESGS